MCVYPGATKTYYIITHAVASDTGDYHCQVKNIYGMAESVPARVHVTTGTTYNKFLISRNADIKYPPSFLALSSNQSLTEGSQSTPVSLDKTFKNPTNPEKWLLGIPEKHMQSLPTKEQTASGL